MSKLDVEELFLKWYNGHIMCDEWGRKPSLADVPLTIMTRKEAMEKRGLTEKERFHEFFEDHIDLLDEFKEALQNKLKRK